MSAASCPLCLQPYHSISRPILTPCRHFLLCRNCLYTEETFTCSDCGLQCHYPDVKVDEELDLWLTNLRENMKNALGGEDETREIVNKAWEDLQKYLKNDTQIQENTEKKTEINALEQFPSSELTVNSGQICEICTMQIPAGYFRCFSCGKVSFSAYQTVHPEEIGRILTVSEEIIQEFLGNRGKNEAKTEVVAEKAVILPANRANLGANSPKIDFEEVKLEENPAKSVISSLKPGENMSNSQRNERKAGSSDKFTPAKGKRSPKSSKTCCSLS